MMAGSQKRYFFIFLTILVGLTTALGFESFNTYQRASNSARGGFARSSSAPDSLTIRHANVPTSTAKPETETSDRAAD